MSEKIYFCGSIRAGRDDQPIYKQLVDHMKQKHGEVLTFHVAEKVQQCDVQATEVEIHDRDMAWLNQCTVVVAEVTVPSLGVGYELGWAAALNRPVLCLFRNNVEQQKSLSAMIRGCRQFQTADYQTVDQAVSIIDNFFKTLHHN